MPFCLFSVMRTRLPHPWNSLKKSDVSKQAFDRWLACWLAASTLGIAACSSGNTPVDPGSSGGAGGAAGAASPGGTAPSPSGAGGGSAGGGSATGGSGGTPGTGSSTTSGATSLGGQAQGGAVAGGQAQGGSALGGRAPLGGQQSGAGSAGYSTAGAGGTTAGGTGNAAGSSSNSSGGRAAGGTAGTSSSEGGTGGRAGGGSGGAGGAGTSGSGGTANNGGASSDRCDVAQQVAGQTPQALALQGNLGAHDPVVIAAHGQYYLFHTGRGLGAKTSTQLTNWQAAPAVFSTNPAWIARQVPGATDLWAPDISFFGGMYHLYYSASTFGSNRSCIGHATRAALNAGSWTDHGSVVCSNPNGGSSDNWNAIDPNVILDEKGKPWLSFGSFWGGLKMIELNESGARANDTLHAIAARPSAGGALEAPFIVRRCGYYYLFASFDSCCKGVDSTYKTMVGRATSVTGPYLDQKGTSMLQGGGTLLLQGSTRYKGPGHNAVLFADKKAYNFYHSYDANNNGNPVLRISELVWNEAGWPVSGGP